jgi:3-phenylpropionate/trans-cinnamate dioxygenase ferredoxin subunit
MAKHFVAHVEDIKPGSLQQVIVADEVLCVARTEQGEFFAIPDACTHESNSSLSDGEMWDECVECPVHGSLFNLRTGEVTGLPAFVPTTSFSIVVDGDDVYVEL